MIIRDGTLYSMGQCTGSFFADTWIITAAHCAKYLLYSFFKYIIDNTRITYNLCQDLI